MSPLAQTGLTLVCMLFSYFVGQKSGIKSGIRYVFSFMTDPEIEKIVMKIEADNRLR